MNIFNGGPCYFFMEFKNSYENFEKYPTFSNVAANFSYENSYFIITVDLS